MSGQRMIALVVSIACLAVNAFFVAAEFALVKVRATQIHPRALRGERRAVAAEAVLEKLDRYLSVTQFGITVASLGLGWIGEPALAHLGDRLALVLTGKPLGSTGHVLVDIFGLGTLTFLHLLLGELVPKAIAIRHTEATALFTALPLRLFNTVFWPVLWFLEHAQRAILRLIHIDPDMTEGALSEEEIVGILAANLGKGAIAKDKQRTVQRVLQFASRPARLIMVPRVDVFSLSIDTPGDEAFRLLKQHEFSRVPLHRGSIDEIEGYLYAKDFLFDEGARSRPTLRGLERHTLFVPEARDGLSVLRDMQGAGVPLAVVVDEYGGTSGILTVEDLVEEVFGEIRDELDVEPDKIVHLDGSRTWDVDATVTVEQLRDAGVPLADVDTAGPVGKIVLDRLGHLPKNGDEAALAEGVIAEVVDTTRRRIRRLRVRTELDAVPVA